MSQRLFLPLVVLAIAAFSYWLSGTQSDKARDKSPAAAYNPNAFMEGVITRVMDKNGLPRYELRSPRLTHYPQDNRTRMEQPQITLFRPDDRYWQLRADSATAFQGDDEILLQGQVLVQRPEATGSPGFELRTSELIVYPQLDRAETQALTTVHSASGELQAEGMRADFNTETVQLLSHVRGHYESN